MIHPKEYKLKGDEFKVLQYIKTLDHPMGQVDMSRKININERKLRMVLSQLYDLFVIEKDLVEYKSRKMNEYTINEVEKWVVE